MKKDLVLLVADKNMQFSVRGGLARPEALGIRPITCDFRLHVGRDGGVRTTGPELLAIERGRFECGVLMLDYEGCGAGSLSPAELESALDGKLRPKWGSQAKAIVLVPEVDVWMWGRENTLRELFDWHESVGIRDWLVQKGFTFDAAEKPLRPKEALDAICRHQSVPRSSSFYEQVARRMSLVRCRDAAFQRLQTTLRSWFPTAEE